AGQSTFVRGLPTGGRINILGSGTMLLSVNYYDSEGRVIQSKSENHLAGTDIVNNTYSFTGELLTSNRSHTSSNGSVNIVTRNEYDAWGRKKNAFEKINSGNEVKIADLEYNETGQLKQKSLHDSIQTTAYAYNPRGWLKTSSSPQFA
ncbi:RHS repeat-associated core domain-containing protein, partial [Pedobacter sp. HMF7056]|nr:RHS repeat-associated core domain-containing protein [Hufsiella ginkgonis]